MRTYELVFIADPRLTDDEVVSLREDYQKMIAANGGEVTKVESWGKRKLAYPINKLHEGKYTLFRLQAAGGEAFAEVEQRMRQNDKILRHLTVRMDAGRLREREARGPKAAEAEAAAKEKR